MTNAMHAELAATIKLLAAKGKGILAADESTPTITKRFAALNIESTADTRRAYREMLLTTPNCNEFIAGVILFEETLQQQTSDQKDLATFLKSLNILSGIKVDKGLVNLANTEEQITQGLDGLPERLAAYKQQGASFAKWRAVYNISANTPTKLAIKTNAEVLARYAAICQCAGIVPIVEPEVLIDGDHTIERAAEVNEAVLRCVFKALARHKVNLEYIVLKPSMVINGKNCSQKASVEEVATQTLTVLRRVVPAAVPTINFLSGGQTPTQATAHLDAMNRMLQASGLQPWNVSFSYARALQEPAMSAWLGQTQNANVAQTAFYKRAKLNSLAALGEYNASQEKENISRVA